VEAGGHVGAIAKEFKVSHDDFYSLLIVVPEEVESHECLNILNFFGFPVNVEEDNICKRFVAREMGFAREDPYPCLLIESAQDSMPSAELTSAYQILTFLRSEGFLADHKSHSAKERQTYNDLIESEVTPLMHEILRPFKTKL
jgi:hypothetical protein